MGITFIVTALHMGICYLLIYQAQVGSAFSTLNDSHNCCTSLCCLAKLQGS